VRDIKEIVVLGGGTAGWITALLCKRYQPEVNVTVIESEEIGILGAGEGTVPDFAVLMEQLQIPVVHLLRHVKATFKHGILFKNWNGKNEQYFHSFGNHNELDLNSLNLSRNLSLNGFLISHAVNEPTVDTNYSERICLQNKVGFKRKDDLIYQDHQSELINYDQLCGYALHFDARELAKFLRGVAEQRGINRINAIAVGLDANDLGVTAILLDNQEKVPCDFIFDCSGFKRFVIHDFFKSKWVSVKETLPCDSAIPFFIENKEEKLESYTEAIALKNGWVWKIPVQGRYGCGYVYDSSFTDEESAKQEVRELFGNVEFPTKFKFGAGYFEEFWIKNCIAVGLSSGFLEPLEATSIWVTTHMVKTALESFDQMKLQDQFVIDEYNYKFRKRFEDIVDFLRLHYITERDDSEFWKNCKTLKNSERLNKILRITEKRVLHYEDVEDSHFELLSWLSILRGVNILDSDISARYIDNNHLTALIDMYGEFKRKIETTTLKSIDHYQFIETVKL
jgi:tryptophan 7-halogenase